MACDCQHFEQAVARYRPALVYESLSDPVDEPQGGDLMPVVSGARPDTQPGWGVHHSLKVSGKLAKVVQDDAQEARL